MSKFSIKSLLLGIGIGIVLTAAVSLVYSMGMESLGKISDEEVIQRAKLLGMVESTELIKKNN